MLDGSKLNHGDHADADLQLVTSVPPHLGMSEIHRQTSSSDAAVDAAFIGIASIFAVRPVHYIIFGYI